MAKRRQTTGLPKQKAKSTTSASGTQQGQREYQSRAEREALLQRRILIGTGVAVGLVILILLVSVIVELVITPNQSVATVNGETISVSQFEEQVRLERAILNQRINGFAANLSAQGLDINQFAGQEPLRTWLAQVQIPDQLGNSVINTMVDDILVRQQAEELGITVSAEQVDSQIVNFIGYDESDFVEDTTEPTATPEPTITPTPFVSPTPSPTPFPTATPEEATEEATEEASDATPTTTPVPATPTLTAVELQDEYVTIRDTFFNQIASSARISQDRLRQYFEMQALREAVRDSVIDLTNEVPHVNARHILVNTDDEAQEIVAALEAGESFADLAQAASTDTGSGARGGELGWAPVTNYVPGFKEAVETGEIGEIIGPVESEFGWHIIQIHAREPREITDAQVNVAKDAEFERWLEATRDSEDNQIEISPIWTDNIPDDPPFFLTGGV